MVMEKVVFACEREACALFSTNESFREDLALTVRKLYTKIISYLKQKLMSRKPKESTHDALLMEQKLNC